MKVMDSFNDAKGVGNSMKVFFWFHLRRDAARVLARRLVHAMEPAFWQTHRIDVLFVFGWTYTNGVRSAMVGTMLILCGRIDGRM